MMETDEKGKRKEENVYGVLLEYAQMR